MDDDRLAALDRKIAELKARVEASSRAAASPRPPATPPDRDAERQRVLDAHQRLLDRHEAEPRLAGWAAKQERDVAANLEALSESMGHAFTFRSVDCRSSSCVAELGWTSRAAAAANLRPLLTGAPDLRCAREIAFPPSDGAATYTASLFLDCAEPASASANVQR